MSGNLKITIPEPCHEDWNNMSPSEQGRFCGSCQKQVVDFSTMSDQQLIAFFKQPTGSLCGRFHGDQLNREIYTPKKRLPWVRYFFQFALPAFLFSFKASGQQTKGKVAATCAPASSRLTGDVIIVGKIAAPKNKVEGKVVDINGDSIPNAQVTIKGSKAGTKTNKNGHFILKETSVDMPLIITAPGYSVKEIAIKSLPPLIVLEKPLQGIMGGVFASVPVQKINNVPLIRSIIDTVTKRLNIYPNPAQAGSLLTITDKRIIPDQYLVQVSDVTGKIILRESMSVAEKNGELIFLLPQTVSGMHLVSLTSSKGKVFTGKIVIQ